MPRFFLEATAWGEGAQQASLSAEESRHLAQVLRLSVGASIEVFDGLGRVAKAEVLSIHKQEVVISFREIQCDTMPSKPLLHLVQAIPKGKNMEWIIQKSVELGVASIQPIITKRTVVHPGDHKAEKWERIALEACKQCGQNRLPQIMPPLSWQAYMQQNQDSIRLIASLDPRATPMKHYLRAMGPSPASITIMVGPEGDFTAEETEQALHQGWQPISLGDLVLRVETATLCLLASLQYEYAG